MTRHRAFRWVYLWAHLMGVGLFTFALLWDPGQAAQVVEPGDNSKVVPDLPQDEDYRIHPKDVLNITVYPDETLTRSVEVNAHGFISFPLVGKFEIQGLTIFEAEKRLAEVLEKDYLVDPVVSIKVESYHENIAVVMGEVKAPASYPIDPSGRTTLMRLIAAAGGFTDIANPSGIKIIRTVDGGEKTIQVNANQIISGKKKDPVIESNDLVIVPESFL